MPWRKVKVFAIVLSLPDILSNIIEKVVYGFYIYTNKAVLQDLHPSPNTLFLK